MKKNLFLTVALVAGLVLAGCSKEDSNNMNTEEIQLQDMKQHIVGTWEKHGEAYVDGWNSIKAHVHDGITDGVDVLFDVDMTPPSEYNPNTLAINADGTFQVLVDGLDPLAGTYEITTIGDDGFNTFLPIYTIRKDDIEHSQRDFSRSQIYNFRYVFFEKGYNTMYLFLWDCETLCRYRRR